MTQIPLQSNSENTDKDRSLSAQNSQVEEQTPGINSSSAPFSLQEQASKDVQTIKSDEQTDRASKAKQPGISLRSQLLLTVLPTVLVPLAVASTVGYGIIQQNSETRIKRQLHDQALLAGKAAREILEQEFKLPAMLAHNPLVIDAARSGSQKVEALNLQQLPIERLEKSFSDTRLLEPNQELNDYLRRTAKIGGVAQLFFTERHGFNIAYADPPVDFVQRDEDWWQQGKSGNRWVSSPDFNQGTKLFSLRLVQAIAAPDSGEFLGVIKSVVSASKFDMVAKYLERAGIAGSQTVQLLDSSTGSVISTATAQGGGSTRRIVGEEAVVAVGTSLTKALQDSAFNLEQGIRDVQTKYSLEQVSVNRFNPETGEQEPTASFIAGDRQYMIATIPGTDWVAVASIDQAEIQSAGSELIAVFALTAVILGAVAVVIIVLLARQLSAPLVNLASTAEQVAAGNLDVVAEPKGTSETQTLAQSFNNLVVQLQGLLEQIESGVEQERQQKTALQGELLQLLTTVERAASGDLTVRAEMTALEIAVVADFFNAIIESLRDLVTQVKQAAAQVNNSVGENEGAIRQLADEATRQATQIANTLNSVEQMTLSIQAVADNAKAAAAVARTASATAQRGGETMDQTVESISQLRSTVAATAKKVKRLGESSQQISKVISLINQIAMQTNLLAINASIEAARAGEEGKGFAVVAEEVGELAARSATATKEIEQIVANIQLETSEVVQAMEMGTTQVVEGTRLVEKTKQSLAEIVEVSRQIDQLVQSISGATVSQAQTSQSVRQFMEEIAQVSERTSDSSREVSSSLQETVAIAQQLQASVGTFKVGDEE